MRLLILITLLYLGYRFFRSWADKHLTSGQTVSRDSGGEIADVMVKDPYCQIYFPRNEGVPLKAPGGDLLFCSSECRDKFVARQSDLND